MLNLGENKAKQAALVKDSTEATFVADVIERSSEVPVIVDFWAPWCGPCKALGPALEAAVADAKGAVELVKVDIDRNQMLAQQMRIQSIPAVYAFVDGRPVDGFVGNVTPAEIKEFVKRLASMGPGGDGGLGEAIAAAEAMLDEGAVMDAAQTFAAILQELPENAAARSGLARTHLALGELDKAELLLQGAPDPAAPELAAARAQLELARDAGDAGEADELRHAVEADPSNLQARYDLAMALVANRKNEAAIDELLEIFRRDREWNEGAAKSQLFKLFDSLGPKDPLVAKGRRKLSSMIFA